MQAKHLRPKHLGRKVELIDYSFKCICKGKLTRPSKKMIKIAKECGLSCSYSIKDTQIYQGDYITFLD